MLRLAWLLICFISPLLFAGELPPPAKHKIDFATEIKPLFAAHCLSCHGPKKQKAELRLDMKGNAIRAKESPIVPGNSAGSPLIQAVAGFDDVVMPPKGDRLTAAQVGLLRAWIDQGAAWPDEHSVKMDDGAAHWSVQPVQRPAPPPVVNAASVRNDVDRFIFAKLDEKNLAPSVEADRRTLIRRLSYDLLGLPPTPERTAAFIQAEDPRAYEQLVDEFLASPHYGERWARHWLDIAHYADTHGFERDMRRDSAWRYRDYVIQSLNADKPYDRFLLEQIAGDVIAPNDRDAAIATGFLAAGPWDFVGQVETPSPMLKRQARGDDLDDMVTQVLAGSVALTVNCARCHDHKLDPILQREYYSLWAVFAGLKRGERPVSKEEQRGYEVKLAALKAEKDKATLEISKRRGKLISLADITGGGNGFGSARKGNGIDPATGKALPDKQDFVKNTRANQYMRGPFACVDGVAIPDGGKDGKLEVPISSTGLKITGLPATSVQAWDAIRHGSGNRYENTRLGEIDYNAEGHTLLSLHANALITFDLNAIRELNGATGLRFTATLGLGSNSDVGNADFHLYLDGVLKARHTGVTKKTPPVALNIELPPAARFLTLISTEGINGISHDQIFLGDPLLLCDPPPAVTDEAKQQLDGLEQ